MNSKKSAHCRAEFLFASFAIAVAIVFTATVAAAHKVVFSFLISPVIHEAHAANLYAQYDDSEILSGDADSFLLPSDWISNGPVSYMQLELNIKDDGQFPAGPNCPVGPNTGKLVFIYRGGAIVYKHCITSAEAEGKLGHKALYSFNDLNFGFGETTGNQKTWISTDYIDEVYGVKGGDGTLYPYLVLADGGGLGSPAVISDLAQYSDGVESVLPENGVSSGSAMLFSGMPSSFFSSDTVQLQVEVRPSGIPFSGVPTAMGSPGASGESASATVSLLVPGPYHWAARAADLAKNYFSNWVEYGTSGNTDFTIATSAAREPVVIVPGIMGSRLRNASTGVEVWPNASKMVREKTDSYLDFLKMSSSGVSLADNSVEVGDIIRSATTTFLGAQFSTDLYADLIDAFVSEGYTEGKDLYIAPYDWRLGVENSISALDAKMQEAVSASGDGKINIIAHSMGGLLIKNYLLTHPNPDFLDKLVLLGVPQLGAPKAYKLLNYGDDLGFSWLGFGLNQEEAKEIAGNMPSVYELLPSRRYVDVAGSYVEDFRNDLDKFLPYDDLHGPNENLSIAADLFHRGMDTLPVNASNVYNIVGCLDPTPVEYHLYDDGVVDIKRATGDGTVPEVSAMNLADGFKNYFALGDETGIDHTGLVKDARSLALVKSIIGGGDPDIPDGFSSAISDCITPRAQGISRVTTIEFSTHGGGVLDIYDSSGKHTGFTSLGDLELGIPGSSYEAIGDNDFALVPAPASGESYNAVDHAALMSSASSTAEVRVRGYSGGDIVQSAAYLSVPFSGASSTASLSFSGFEGDMGLAVDNDGDGSNDSVLQPDTIAYVSSSEDFDPPIIIMPVISPQVLEMSTGTLTFDVRDEGSGIASTSAYLNGEPAVSGKEIIFDKIGSNVFTITAVDNAGNEQSGELEFDVVEDGGEGGIGEATSTEQELQDSASGQVGGSISVDVGRGGGGGGGGVVVASGGGGNNNSGEGAVSPDLNIDDAAAVPAGSVSTINISGMVLGASTTTDLFLKLAELKKQLVALQIRAGGSCTSDFTENLSLGSGGYEVKSLQEMLNRSALTEVGAAGPGSAGEETQYFGEATFKAVAAFQAIFKDEILVPSGLALGTGYFGPATRGVLNSICSS